MAQNVASAPAPRTRHEPAFPGPPERRAAQPHKQRHTYGALDLGTNNCRLLIARPTDGGFTVIDAFSRIVRLGDGTEESARRMAEGLDWCWRFIPELFEVDETLAAGRSAF